MTATRPDSTQAAFLNAIRGEPGTPWDERARMLADNAPRLVYADWLDEHGDEAKAEFIRVQVAIERWPKSNPKQHLRHGPGGRWQYDDPKETSLRSRERELLRENAILWLASLPPCWTMNLGDGTRIGDCRTGTSYDVKFSRGFLSHVTLPMESWIGRECERCGGSGVTGLEIGDYGCETCSGTGRVGAHGRDIIRSPASAVERVTFSDIELDRDRDGSYSCYRFAGRFGSIFDPKKLALHRTESAALAAASKASIEWATS